MKKKTIVITAVSAVTLLLGTISTGVMANDYLNRHQSPLNEFVDYPYNGNIAIKTAKPTEKITLADVQPKPNNIAIAESIYQDLTTRYPNHKIDVYLITGGQYKDMVEPQPQQQFITVDFDQELINQLLANQQELVKLNNYVAEKAQQLDDSLKYGNPISNDQIIIDNSFNRNLLDRSAADYPTFNIQHSKHTNIQKMLGGTYYE